MSAAFFAMLEKTFDPKTLEPLLYSRWEASGAFAPEHALARDPQARPYCIVIPPPNVTGSLHIGHALNQTLQDVLARYHRMRGEAVLWLPGSDHAGIATQMVVERQLSASGNLGRRDMGRDAFLEKVWAWKAESGGAITRQMRRLGSSCDWSRERFTLDDGLSAAVRKVFVTLYKQGLIYRDKRLVNWDPRLKTAISDLEVETQEIKGGFWRFRYPLADGVTRTDGLDFIEVATTRPETMLADMVVAVHPDDARYASVIGAFLEQPLTGRRLRIVADEHADPELGSGAVKITPGHDFNDFEVGKRAGIKPADMLNMFDAQAQVVQTADGLVPPQFLGQDRFAARQMIVAAMKDAGLLVPHVDKDGAEHDCEPRTIQTPFGDRGGVVIEPWLTDQWYVDAAALASKPIAAVRSGAIEIVPKTWEKTFFNWMDNIQPWCVSRQLWWGHRIPAWYDAEGKAYVAHDEAAAQAQAGAGVALTRDEDVLDTWFSSALWPFATLGWPDDDAMVKRHYPNDLLISGFDILFFWDARMAMQGLQFMGEVPWRRLYLHGLVRAADGQKMSKSKGNVVDPLVLIDQYGADALRFFMCAMESQGRDVKMDERRVEGYRNFATKLWNAARFCQANGIGASTSITAPVATHAVNRWIIGEVVETLGTLDQAMADLRFDAAANVVYQFAWGAFCDWYIEFIKGNFDDETRAVAGWVLDQILVMLHPFMPFVTEELWHALASPTHPREADLILARWPQPGAAVDAAAKAEVEWLIALVSGLRTARNELGLPPGAKLEAWLPEPSDATRAVIAGNGAAIDRLARLSAIHFAPAPAGAAMQVGAGDATLIVPLEGLIDIGAERARLEKALATAEKEAGALAGRLNNASFVERAKPEAVDKARADHAHHTAEAARLAAALARLG